jgi:16S rRNA A1518/A1519 N6-dimethyltransferase RsmA/KsgA/DIM1 with predicted DNA glycosylase/AP lyase activity
VSEQALTTAGIDPSARAETLELEAFVRLTEAIGELRLSGH